MSCSLIFVSLFHPKIYLIFFLNFGFKKLFLHLQVADGLPGVQKAEILGLCDEVDILSRQLSDLCRRGLGDSPQAHSVAR